MAPCSTAVAKSSTLAAKPVGASAAALNPRCPVGTLDPNDDQGTDGTPPKASISAAGSVSSAAASVPGNIKKPSGILVSTSTGLERPLTSSKSVAPKPIQTRQEPSATAMSFGAARTVIPRQLGEDEPVAADLTMPSASAVPGGNTDLEQSADPSSGANDLSTDEVTDSSASTADASDTSVARGGDSDNASAASPPYPAGNSTVSGPMSFGSGVPSPSTSASDEEAPGSDSDFQSDADTLASPGAGSDFGSEDTFVNSPVSGSESSSKVDTSEEDGSQLPTTGQGGSFAEDGTASDSMSNSKVISSESAKSFGEVDSSSEDGGQLPSTGQEASYTEDDTASGAMINSKVTSSKGIESPTVLFPVGQKIRVILSPLSSGSAAPATSNSLLATPDQIAQYIPADSTEDVENTSADSTEDVQDTSADSTEDVQATSADSIENGSSPASGNSSDTMMPRAPLRMRQAFGSTTDSSASSMDGSTSVPSASNTGPDSVPNESYVDVVVNSEGKLVPDPDPKATHSPSLLHLLESLNAQDTSATSDASIVGNDDSATAVPGAGGDLSEAGESESMPQGEPLGQDASTTSDTSVAGKDDSATMLLGLKGLNATGTGGSTPQGKSKRHAVRDHKTGHSGVVFNEKREPWSFFGGKSSTLAATPTHGSAVTAPPNKGRFSGLYDKLRGKNKSNSATPTSYGKHATSIATTTHGPADHSHSGHPGHSDHPGHGHSGHSGHELSSSPEGDPGAYPDSGNVEDVQSAPNAQDASPSSADAMGDFQESGTEFGLASEGQDLGSAGDIPQDRTTSDVSPGAAGIDDPSQAETMSQGEAGGFYAIEKRTPKKHKGDKHTTKSSHSGMAPSHTIKHATTMITSVRSGYNDYAEATMTSRPGTQKHGHNYLADAQALPIPVELKGAAKSELEYGLGSHHGSTSSVLHHQHGCIPRSNQSADYPMGRRSTTTGGNSKLCPEEEIPDEPIGEPEYEQGALPKSNSESYVAGGDSTRDFAYANEQSGAQGGAQQESSGSTDSSAGGAGTKKTGSKTQ